MAKIKLTCSEECKNWPDDRYSIFDGRDQKYFCSWECLLRAINTDPHFSDAGTRIKDVQALLDLEQIHLPNAVSDLQKVGVFRYGENVYGIGGWGDRGPSSNWKISRDRLDAMLKELIFEAQMFVRDHRLNVAWFDLDEWLGIKWLVADSGSYTVEVRKDPFTFANSMEEYEELNDKYSMPFFSNDKVEAKIEEYTVPRWFSTRIEKRYVFVPKKIPSCVVLEGKCNIYRNQEETSRVIIFADH